MTARANLMEERALADGLAARALGWMATDVRQLLGKSGATLVERSIRALSLATSKGHVCLTFAEFAAHDAHASDDDPTAGALPDEPGSTAGALPSEDAWRRTLLASGIVGSPAMRTGMPFVLDDEGRLYLHRHFDYERRLALRLQQAARAAPFEVGEAARAMLVRAFPDNAGAPRGRIDWQRIAAALALRNRLTVISGGPGTGKTTTVVGVLACLLAQDRDCRIALAAPTCKAAARMIEAVQDRAKDLPPEIRERLPAQSFTIHRLLRTSRHRQGGFEHDAERPLAIDALVVDEASMLDLALATKLLEAVPASARVILLGDKDQLAAVESGAVFAELGADPALSAACRDDIARFAGVPADQLLQRPAVAGAATHPSPLPDTVAWLTEPHRFAHGSAIYRLADAIRLGDAPQAIAMVAAGEAGLTWIDDDPSAPTQRALQHAARGFEPFLAAVLADPADRKAIVDAFGRFRVLCALREGPRSASAFDDWCSRQARAALSALIARHAVDGRSEWYPGRPVMVLKNDYLLQLFNGDIGITLPDGNGGLAVCFPAGRDDFRMVPTPRMPPHRSAFAMTVHASQGSQFPGVMLVLPDRPSRVVTRELLYTAVTRASASVTLCAGADVLQQGIATPTRRHSGLLARLREGSLAA
jgi:exodeoxyribonuclease V alpha subunit